VDDDANDKGDEDDNGNGNGDCDGVGHGCVVVYFVTTIPSNAKLTSNPGHSLDRGVRYFAPWCLSSSLLQSQAMYESF
jgi:hypothetical protein